MLQPQSGHFSTSIDASYRFYLATDNRTIYVTDLTKYASASDIGNAEQVGQDRFGSIPQIPSLVMYSPTGGAIIDFADDQACDSGDTATCHHRHTYYYSSLSGDGQLTPITLPKAFSTDVARNDNTISSGCFASDTLIYFVDRQAHLASYDLTTGVEKTVFSGFNVEYLLHCDTGSAYITPQPGSSTAYGLYAVNLATSKATETIPKLSGGSSSGASSDGTRIWNIEGTNVVYYDTVTGKELGRVNVGCDNSFNCRYAMFSPDAQYILVAMRGGKDFLVRVSDKKIVQLNEIDNTQGYPMWLRKQDTLVYNTFSYTKNKALIYALGAQEAFAKGLKGSAINGYYPLDAIVASDLVAEGSAATASALQAMTLDSHILVLKFTPQQNQIAANAGTYSDPSSIQDAHYFADIYSSDLKSQLAL